MKFNVNPEDFLKGKLVNPGYHPAVISSYEEKLSKRRQDSPADWSPSAYVELQFTIVDGEFKGTIVYTNFSEKAPSFIVPLLEALGQKIDKTKPASFDIRKETMMGQKVDIMVVRGSYNGKPKNEIEGFRPFSGRVVNTSAQAGV